MTTTLPAADLRTRIVAGLVRWCSGLGLSRLASSPLARSLGTRWLPEVDPGGAVRTVASGLARGARLAVLPTTPRSYWLGTHEILVQEQLPALVLPGGVAYDCGANVGLFSIALSRLVGPAGKVYAFEASPRSFACLRRTCELNALENVTPVFGALWNEPGVVRFPCRTEGARVGDCVAGVHGEEGPLVPFEEVPALVLDDFAAQPGMRPPALLKIDVEGAEGRVLQGARRLLRTARPTLLLEVHGGPGAPAWDVLQESGYTIRDLVNGTSPRTREEFAVWIREYIATPAESERR